MWLFKPSDSTSQGEGLSSGKKLGPRQAREDYIAEAACGDIIFSSVDKAKVEFKLKRHSINTSGLFFFFCDISA